MAFDLSTAKLVQPEEQTEPTTTAATSKVSGFDLSTAQPVYSEPEPQKIESGPIVPGESTSVLTGKPISEQELLQPTIPFSETEKTVRPALETGGLIGGGIIGTPGGPILQVTGAGLGYAAGASIADVLYGKHGDLKEEALKTGKNIVIGGSYEAGGQSLGVIIGSAYYGVKKGNKWIFNKIAEPIKRTFSQKAAEKAAGEVIIANTSNGAIYAKNAKEAAELEKKIPGLKFTVGQRTRDPNIIKLERAQVRKPGIAAQLLDEQTAKNNEALRKYYEQNFPGGSGIDDLVSNLNKQQETLQRGVSTAEKTIQAESSRLPQVGPEETGQRITDTLRTQSATAKTAADELYGNVENVTVDIADMLSGFDKISKPMSKFENTRNIPNLLGVVRRYFGKKTGTGILDAQGNEIVKEIPKQLGIEDLQGLRSEFLDLAARAKSAINPNRRLASRYSQAAEAVQSAIVKAGQKSEALLAANKFFKEDYAEIFRQGIVGDILTPGARREISKIPLAQIPSKIWNTRNLTAADQFIKATGNDSQGIMADYAAYDLMQSMKGKITTQKLHGWLAKNRPLLKKFGLTNYFNNLRNAQAIVDKATEAATSFEKTAAARILKADPEKAIAAAFTGSSPAQQAQKLVQSLGNDIAAKRGLQKAYADYMVNRIQTTAKDAAGNITISNAQFQKILKDSAGILRVIYKDAPEKVKVIKNLRDAYEIAIRNTKSPIGGGSDTAENLFSELLKVNVLWRPATIVRGILSIFGKHGDEKISELVTRGLFDAEYAEFLKQAARQKTIPEFTSVIDEAITKLNRYQIGEMLGAQAVSQKQEQSQ